jgi:hypothetical protein
MDSRHKGGNDGDFVDAVGDLIVCVARRICGVSPSTVILGLDPRI